MTRRLARIGVAAFGITIAVGCDAPSYEEPKVVRQVEAEPLPTTPPQSDDARPGDETSMQKLALRLTATATGGATATFDLAPAAAEGEAVLMAPKSGSASLVIPPTADDLTTLSFVFEVRPAHAFPRTLNVIAAVLDTYYVEGTSSEEKLHTLQIHKAASFQWQASTGGYAHGYSIRVNGFSAFNDDFGASKTIRRQALTFMMGSGATEGQGRAIVASVPVSIGG